jgi:hypothetical protein
VNSSENQGIEEGVVVAEIVGVNRLFELGKQIVGRRQRGREARLGLITLARDRLGAVERYGGRDRCQCRRGRERRVDCQQLVEEIKHLHVVGDRFSRGRSNDEGWTRVPEVVRTRRSGDPQLLVRADVAPTEAGGHSRHAEDKIRRWLEREREITHDGDSSTELAVKAAVHDEDEENEAEKLQERSARAASKGYYTRTLKPQRHGEREVRWPCQGSGAPRACARVRI